MLRKKQKRITRHRRVRARVKGTSKKPRLSVFRSSKYIYVQLIDDDANKTLLSASDLKLKIKGKMNRARQVGEIIAKKALEAGIKKVVFDRGGFEYHGRVKILAEAAREGGLEF